MLLRLAFLVCFFWFVVGVCFLVFGVGFFGVVFLFWFFFSAEDLKEDTLTVYRSLREMVDIIYAADILRKHIKRRLSSLLV